jgi:hypothetical protein
MRNMREIGAGFGLKKSSWEGSWRLNRYYYFGRLHQVSNEILSPMKSQLSPVRRKRGLWGCATAWHIPSSVETKFSTHPYHVVNSLLPFKLISRSLLAIFFYAIYFHVMAYIQRHE